MARLIDTDVAIHLRDGDVATTLRLLEFAESPALSLLSVVELEGGAAADTPLGIARRAHLDRLLAEVEVISFDLDVVAAYGQLISRLGFSRRRVLDRLIAATALVHDMTLVTMNGADFRNIPDLKLEVWSSPAQ